jgi:hypothetical protein
MPSLDGVAGWLNSEPLGLAELRGYVVLVNCWTLMCSKWLRRIRTPWRAGRNMPCDCAWRDEQVELSRAGIADGAPA